MNLKIIVENIREREIYLFLKSLLYIVHCYRYLCTSIYISLFIYTYTYVYIIHTYTFLHIHERWTKIREDKRRMWKVEYCNDNVLSDPHITRHQTRKKIELNCGGESFSLTKNYNRYNFKELIMRTLKSICSEFTKHKNRVIRFSFYNWCHTSFLKPSKYEK